jgi:hypothetical protein
VGLVRVELKLTLPGQRLNSLEIRIDGRPLGGGGVAMSASHVTLGSAASLSLYRGQITGLEGTTVAARVRSRRGALALVAQLQIDSGSGAVSGAVSAQPTRETKGDR